jgi:hypothetical protein
MHVVELPVQFCAGVGGVMLAALHTVVLGCRASAGHSAAVPLHCSAASQSPAAVLQTVVLGLLLYLQLQPATDRQYADVLLAVHVASMAPAQQRQM